MKYFKIATILIVATLFNQSCSIEKRRYRKGYHVEWNKNVKTRKIIKEQTATYTDKEENAKSITAVNVFKTTKAEIKQQSIIESKTSTVRSNKILPESIGKSIVLEKKIKQKESNKEIQKQKLFYPSKKINDDGSKEKKTYEDRHWLIKTLMIVLIISLLFGLGIYAFYFYYTILGTLIIISLSLYMCTAFCVTWDFEMLTPTYFGEDLGLDVLNIVGLIIKLAILFAIIMSFILFPEQALFVLVVLIAIGAFIFLLSLMMGGRSNSNSSLFWWGPR